LPAGAAAPFVDVVCGADVRRCRGMLRAPRPFTGTTRGRGSVTNLVDPCNARYDPSRASFDARATQQWSDEFVIMIPCYASSIRRQRPSRRRARPPDRAMIHEAPEEPGPLPQSAVAKYAASFAAPTRRSAYTSRTMLMTKPRSKAGSNAVDAGQCSRKHNPSATLNAPEESAFT
jgi:hypothetical protein